MLKSRRDLFMRKIIAVILLMVGFNATDILGQQNMTAKTQQPASRFWRSRGNCRSTTTFASSWIRRNNYPNTRGLITAMSLTRITKFRRKAIISFFGLAKISKLRSVVHTPIFLPFRPA